MDVLAASCWLGTCVCADKRFSRILPARGQFASGRHRYAAVMGEESRCRHKEHLIRKIAWRIQALAEGDLSERARRRAKELANDADVA